MTNKEKYKQAFSVLHLDDNFNLEVASMEKTKKQHRVGKIVASVAACVLILGSATTAYAANVGGIQRMVQIWLHGDQTDAALTFGGAGNYTMDYVDEEGNQRQQSGGGVAFEMDGSERPLTQEELMEELNTPEVEYEEDGSVWVYWYDQKVEITDKFEDGICYVKLDNGEKVLYMTVRYQDGYATSPRKYVTPSEF